MPIISDKIPGPCRLLRAGDIMAIKPKCLFSVDTLENIGKFLTTTDHHAFPITNKNGKLIGIVPRNFIIVLLRNHAWYGITENEDQYEGKINGSFEKPSERKRRLTIDQMDK